MASQLATKDDNHSITATGCGVQERDDHRSHQSMKDVKGACHCEDEREARSGIFTDYENAVDPVTAPSTKEEGELLDDGVLFLVRTPHHAHRVLPPWCTGV
jgi:hypothetical protein